MSVPLRGQDPKAIAQAADVLAAGDLVAFPTETVYGLGARADDPGAVLKIFRTKGRPENHPLIVHVADALQLRHFAASVPPVAQDLIDAFWPGPLTVILPRLDGMAAAAAGHQNSIGLRCPAHPVAQALLREALARGVPGVAAPSANRFGRVSPTSADHVRDEFDALLSDDELLILDGGPCPVGIESTIVDCSRGHPVLLRPGRLTLAEIEAVAGEPVQWSRPEAPDLAAPRASGTLAAHYAPRAKVRMMSEDELHDALDALEPQLSGARHPQVAWVVAVYSRSLWSHRAPHPGVLHRPMPGDAATAAHELFADLREMDAHGVGDIWVEHPPFDPGWDGVRDRLMRAAAA